MKMDGKNPRRWLASAAVGAGLVLGAAGVAGAATSGSSSSSSGQATTPAASAQAPAAPAQGGQMDPSKVAHGPGETLLTGSTAASVTAAAKAAVPGATVIRVETDNEGAAYEAHLKKSDGTFVTIKLDKSFKVTATESGFGRGPANGQAPSGQAPSGAQAPTA